MTCWQQRADPEVEANVNKRRKQRPVSIAGDSVDNLTAGGLKQIKRTPSMGSLVIPEDGVMRASSTCLLRLKGHVFKALCALLLPCLVGFCGPMCICVTPCLFCLEVHHGLMCIVVNLSSGLL